MITAIGPVKIRENNTAGTPLEIVSGFASPKVIPRVQNHSQLVN